MSNKEIPQIDNIVYASIIKRILATSLDFIFFILVLTLIAILTNYNYIFKFISTFFSIFACSIYPITTQTIFGTTFGKYIMKIKVLKNDFTKVDFYTMLKKYFIDLIIDTLHFFVQIYVFYQVYNPKQSLNSIFYNHEIKIQDFILTKIVGGIFLFYWILKLITILFDKKIRAIHDIISNTVVIYDKK